MYMSVCQAMNGQGGWPLTIIMAPDCKPFFSGTYFSALCQIWPCGAGRIADRGGRAVEGGRETFLDSAGQIEAHLKAQERITMSAEPGVDAVHQAFRQFWVISKKNGGFGGAPKFPTPHNLIFLMEYGVKGEEAGSACDGGNNAGTDVPGRNFDHIEADSPDILRMKHGWCRILKNAL